MRHLVVDGKMLQRHDALAGNEFRHLIHEEEREAMGENALDGVGGELEFGSSINRLIG